MVVVVGVTAIVELLLPVTQVKLEAPIAAKLAVWPTQSTGAELVKVNVKLPVVSMPTATVAVLLQKPEGSVTTTL